MAIFTDALDFYPTPRTIGRRMYQKIQNKNAYYFLDPSAGKGDLAGVMREPTTIDEFEAEDASRFKISEEEREERRYRRQRVYDYSRDNSRVIDCIETHPGLCSVLRDQDYQVVGFDWLTYEGVSYYDVIMMNPPFSQGAAHLLKAWDFLHHGEIVCLLNAETIKNPYTIERKRLLGVIAANDGEVEYLGACFDTAERKTGVEVAMVYLNKKATDDTFDMWAKSTTTEKDPGVEFGGDPTMLAIRDKLGNMEHWFNMANEHWMQGIEHIRKAKLYMNQNHVPDGKPYGSHEEDFADILKLALDNVYTCRAKFLRRHRKQAWTSVFNQMEFHKWLDSKQQEQFLRDVQRDSTIAFTATHIKGTLENVWLQRGKLFDQSVANVFDELTSHHAGNTNVKSEGWKSNDSFKVNGKLVFPNGCRYGNGFSSSYGSSSTIYVDLDRILCVLDGTSFENCQTVSRALSKAFDEYRKTDNNTAESQYFDIRFFKKGTVHLKWKRVDLLNEFNRRAAAGKMWIGQNTQQDRPRKPKRGPGGERSCDQLSWRTGHTFVEGKCDYCGELEVDPYAAIACPLCRSVAEVTGVAECPLHPFEHVAVAETGQLQITAA